MSTAPAVHIIPIPTSFHSITLPPQSHANLIIISAFFFHPTHLTPISPHFHFIHTLTLACSYFHTVSWTPHTMPTSFQSHRIPCPPQAMPITQHLMPILFQCPLPPEINSRLQFRYTSFHARFPFSSSSSCSHLPLPLR